MRIAEKHLHEPCSSTKSEALLRNTHINRRMRRLITFLFLTCFWTETASFGQEQAANPPAAPRLETGSDAFEFFDGDRVVLLGDTLIEREQLYSYVETQIVARYPDRNITFRNLGWSADTVTGQSRVSFDWNKGETEWFKQLMADVASVKPTVAILGYGMAHSFDGEGGLPKFKAGLVKLITAIRELSADRPVRFILLSPIRHENLGAPWPDPTEHNRAIALYAKAIEEIAQQENCRYIPLIDLLDDSNSSEPVSLTGNGIHLSAVGYWRLAEAIEIGLGWLPTSWRLGITTDGRVRPGSQFIEVENVVRREDYVRFTALSDVLERPPAPEGKIDVPHRSPPYLLQIQKLKPGNYTLKVDGETIGEFSDQQLHRGRVINRGPSFAHSERLRQTILRKNELYFHRWRPQNETYLFGFRKYEQGQNAREIPMFDPLVEAEEAKIAQLRKPIKRTFEIAVKPEPPAAPPAEPQGNETKNSTSDPKPGAPTAADNPAQASRTEPTAEKTASPGSAQSSKPASSPLPAPTPRPHPKFEIADGFEIQVFAEDPQLAKPIQMNFDPQGRLWVASSSVYPQIEPGQVADDKILVLEDTDRDGKADKSVVFAGGLLIPTGIEPGDGGAYVGQSTELLHFKDVDGDGKSDQKRVVLSGFGTEDTHHIIHTLRWGHDGQLYFNQSIYIHSHIETPHGVVRLNSGGIFHLRPTNLELGILSKGWVNSWGHDFDPFGQSFVTDGAGSQGINYAVPGAMYVAYAGARRILGSVSPGSYPKFCGIELISSEHFPPDWQGNAVTCDFRAHRIVRFAINEQGSAYVTQQMPDLLRSSDVTFRPIDVKLGPDGALYVADWSNPIIQHGEVDFRDPRRDHERGRIWRITAKGRPLVPRPALTEQSNAQLLEQLLSPNAFNKRQARRILSERGKAIVNDLAAWTKTQSRDEALLEALWTYQAIDTVEAALLERLAAAKDGRIRAAAVRVLSFWHKRISDPMQILARAIQDEHPRVRLEALRAISRIPSTRSAELVLSTLEKPMDPFLDYAVWLSINDLAQPWVDAIRSGQWKLEGRERQLEFGLQAIEPALAGSVLAQLLESRSIPRDGSGPWIELIGKAGGPRELEKLFDELVVRGFSHGATEPAVVRALQALSEAARVRKAKPDGDLNRINQLLEKSPAHEKAAAAAVRLAGSWNTEQERVRTLAADLTVSEPVRLAAIDALQELGGEASIGALRQLTTEPANSAVRHAAAIALGRIDLPQSASNILAVLAESADENQAAATWRALLSNRGSAKVLTTALSKTTLPSSVAKVGMRAAREGGRNEPELIVALARSGNLEEEARQLTPAELGQLVAKVTQQGDPARGELIFRRAELGCVGCHAIGGAGGKVGPDLTSLGASAPIDYLIESLFYPNRKVKEGYHSLLIETKDGLEYSGILVRENNEQLVIRDATNRELPISKPDIQKRTIGGSIMPSGLIDTLPADEQIHLIRFLSELGKAGPYDAAKGHVARHWHLLAATIDLAQFGDDRVLRSQLTDPGWSSAISLVDGRLLKESMIEKLKAVAGRDPSSLYAATRLQVPNDSTVTLQLSGAPYQAVWIDGKPLSGSIGLSADLAAGIHTVVVKLDAKQLPEFIRLESGAGTFLTN